MCSVGLRTTLQELEYVSVFSEHRLIEMRDRHWLSPQIGFLLVRAPVTSDKGTSFVSEEVP